MHPDDIGITGVRLRTEGSGGRRELAAKKCRHALFVCRAGTKAALLRTVPKLGELAPALLLRLAVGLAHVGLTVWLVPNHESATPATFVIRADAALTVGALVCLPFGLCSHRRGYFRLRAGHRLSSVDWHARYP